MSAPTAPLLVIHRRPPLRHIAFVLVLALLFAAGGSALAHMLMAEPSWLVAGPVGCALGCILLLHVWSGCTVRVTADRTLIYCLRGLDMIAVPLAEVTGFTVVRTGALTGVGVACPDTALRFLARKGPTRRHVEAWQRALGVALVLEHLHPEDATILENLRTQR